MKKHTIQLALSQKGVEVAQLLLNNDEKHLEKLKNYTYYYKVIHHRENNLKEKDDFIHKFINKQEEVKTKYSYPQLVIFIELNDENRILVAKISNCKGVIDKSKLEKNFGLKIGINYALANAKDQNTKIKKISTRNYTTADANIIINQKPIDTNNLYFDEYDTMLQEITLTYNNGVKNKSIKASSFFCPNEIDLQEKIDVVIEKLYNFYKNYYINEKNGKLYWDKFKFLDHMKIITDSSTKNNEFEILNRKLNNIIKEKKYNDLDSLENISLAWPDIEHSDHDHYEIISNNSSKKENPTLQYLDLQNICNVLADSYPRKTKWLDIIINSRDENNKKLDTFKIKECIFYEEDTEDNKELQNGKGLTKILYGGNWYEIDNDFAKRTDNEYGKLDNWVNETVELSPWRKLDEKKWEKEQDYNYRQVKELKERYVNNTNDVHIKLLDRKNVNIGLDKKLELCDILVMNKEKETNLVFVKRCANSPSISHLIAQLGNSYRFVVNRNNIKTISKQIGIDEKDIDTQKFHYVLAIAAKKSFTKHEKLPYIPFFARLTLINRIIGHHNNNIRIEIKYIQINDKI